MNLVLGGGTCVAQSQSEGLRVVLAEIVSQWTIRHGAEELNISDEREEDLQAGKIGKENEGSRDEVETEDNKTSSRGK